MVLCNLNFKSKSIFYVPWDCSQYRRIFQGLVKPSRMIKRAQFDLVASNPQHRIPSSSHQMACCTAGLGQDARLKMICMSKSAGNPPYYCVIREISHQLQGNPRMLYLDHDHSVTKADRVQLAAPIPQEALLGLVTRYGEFPR